MILDAEYPEPATEPVVNINVDNGDFIYGSDNKKKGRSLVVHNVLKWTPDGSSIRSKDMTTSATKIMEALDLVELKFIEVFDPKYEHLNSYGVLYLVKEDLSGEDPDYTNHVKVVSLPEAYAMYMHRFIVDGVKGKG